MAFTKDFETLWTATGRRHGHKEAAFRAYVKRGSPDPARVALAWTAYVASLPDWQSPQHLSTWLNQGGHLGKYGSTPKDGKQAAAGGFVPSEYPEFED